MNYLAPLIEQLAKQFGTTSEYLWNVLISQAAISATISLIKIIAIIIFGIILYRLNKKFMKSNEHGDSLYAKHESALAVPMVIGAIAMLVFVFIAFYNFSNVITGYLNPEYWALEQVLDAIKPSGD